MWCQLLRSSVFLVTTEIRGVSNDETSIYRHLKIIIQSCEVLRKRGVTYLFLSAFGDVWVIKELCMLQGNIRAGYRLFQVYREQGRPATPTQEEQLLVILSEADGARYLVSNGFVQAEGLPNYRWSIRPCGLLWRHVAREWSGGVRTRDSWSRKTEVLLQNSNLQCKINLMRER